LDDVENLPKCGFKLRFNSLRSCQLSGQYVLVGGNWEESPNPNEDSEIFLLVVAEIGVYSTVNIAPETSPSFQGEYENDIYLIYGESPNLTDC
jgi:hypothetical protein